MHASSAEPRDDVPARPDEAARLRLLVHDAPDLTLILDSDGVVTYASAAAEHFLHQAPEEVVGQRLLTYCHPSERALFERQLKTVCDDGVVTATGQVRLADVELTDLAGTPCTIRRSVEFVVRDLREEPAVVGLVVHMHDVTERVQMEDAMMRKHALDVVGRLAGGIAHDFNNLLVVVNGYSEFLSMSENLDEEERVAVEEIHTAGNRAASLTNQLLSFSRRQMSSPRLVDLNQVVSDAAADLASIAGSNELRIQLGEHQLLTRLDSRQLREALAVLVTNAQDALSGRSDGRIDVVTQHLASLPDVLLHHDTTGRYVAVAVRDNGCGMSDEVHTHLFEPFFTTKEVGQGTGLGLATVHGFVKQHKGYIIVETEMGQGSTFILYFPEELGVVEAAPEAPTEGASWGGTVLVVEDEDLVRGLVSSLLRQEGYRVLTAEGYHNALAVWDEQGPVDLLLTDLLLPDGNGRDVAAVLRERRPELPVVYMSGFYGDTVLDSLGADSAFLQKPFTRGALLSKVAELAARAERPVHAGSAASRQLTEEAKGLAELREA